MKFCIADVYTASPDWVAQTCIGGRFFPSDFWSNVILGGIGICILLGVVYSFWELSS